MFLYLNTCALSCSIQQKKTAVKLCLFSLVSCTAISNIFFNLFFVNTSKMHDNFKSLFNVSLVIDQSFRPTLKIIHFIAWSTSSQQHQRPQKTTDFQTKASNIQTNHDSKNNNCSLLHKQTFKYFFGHLICIRDFCKKIAKSYSNTKSS